MGAMTPPLTPEQVESIATRESEPFVRTYGPHRQHGQCVPVSLDERDALVAMARQALELEVKVSVNPIYKHEDGTGGIESTDLFIEGRGVSVLCNVECPDEFSYSVLVDGERVSMGMVGDVAKQPEAVVAGLRDNLQALVENKRRKEARP
jgi:hypothetical protein